MSDQGEPAEPEERGGGGGDDADGPGGAARAERDAADGRGAGDAGGADVTDSGGEAEPDRPDRPAGPAPRRHLPAQGRIAVGVLGPALLTTAYFTIPFGALGPKHRILSWLILAGLLTLLAVGMVVTTNRTLTDRSGRYGHPGVGILLLSWASILTFAASYWAMATRHGEFVGLQTRLDALYFTGVTMATVGYGDIHPSGQVARGAVLVQLVYTFAFLVSGITALRTRTRARMARRMGE